MSMKSIKSNSNHKLLHFSDFQSIQEKLFTGYTTTKFQIGLLPLFCKLSFICGKRLCFLVWWYRKIPKISPGVYIFQRPFLRGLFLEGLIFGGAYLQRAICVSKSIGLALQLEVNYRFGFVFLLYLRAIFQVQAPGGVIFEGAI